MSEVANQNRRELSSRNTNWARNTAAFLAKRNISPNQISVLSMIFGLLAFGAFFMASMTSDGHVIYLAIALVGIMGRLLCNLFDGMVAIEFHKKSAVGELYNDVPDRISDFFILLGAGFLVPMSFGGMHLPWFCIFLATLTAYMRMLSASTGAGHHFLGPMAKQHRMALINAATVIEMFTGNGVAMGAAFTVMAVLLVVTNVKRLMKVADFLNQKEQK
jgi:phosphatidylglycerophosphate synthase